jgi:NADPH:quinone reductase-like Zn-dependent oxidoreductase
MKAIILKDFGGVEQLELTELPTPVIGEGEVLVQIKAISINPVDVKTRAGKGAAGKLKGESPMILGWDIAGIVTESRAEEFEAGDEVFGMVNFPGHGRAYAEYVAAPADQLALKPTTVNFESAAAATLAALTAWQAFSDHGRLRAGQRVLIHAAAGGVGHFAVQIARHIGAYVIGTASAENKEFVLGLGANECIDYKTERFEEVVQEYRLCPGHYWRGVYRPVTTGDQKRRDVGEHSFIGECGCPGKGQGERNFRGDDDGSKQRGGHAAYCAVAGRWGFAA